MTFQQAARRAQSSALPMGARVIALHQCAEKYSPIGFHATLDYLESTAGPYRSNEAALVAAVAVLRQAHSLWQEELGSYAAERRSAKRAGQRVPRRSDPNPNALTTWHGHQRVAALFAVGRWRRLTGDGHSSSDQERLVRELADLALSSKFSPDDDAALEELRAVLDESASWDLYRQDPAAYFRARSLGRIVHHLRVATREAADA
ncbi:hypothetical protein [Nocardioides renjunii]|uniref:hypothetical protein n=1 Tax=Nocardioides renjunii TaxID=3095075 RepID=UPI002AFF6394|nr:hypothetical protein [Nocardioides sp. S-34]WQQ20412.1 hypothetical protein SHK17_10865 [Nocardioides sp. S-34]